jgi:hypothetical protein
MHILSMQLLIIIQEHAKSIILKVFLTNDFFDMTVIREIVYADYSDRFLKLQILAQFGILLQLAVVQNLAAYNSRESITNSVGNDMKVTAYISAYVRTVYQYTGWILDLLLNGAPRHSRAVAANTLPLLGWCSTVVPHPSHSEHCTV